MTVWRTRRRLVGATAALVLVAGSALVAGVRGGLTAWATPLATVDLLDGAATVDSGVMLPTRTPVSLPPTSPPPGSIMPGCTSSGPSAAIDREMQRAWLCSDGALVEEFPITTAWGQPDPGSYRVWSRSRYAFAYEDGTYSMEYFVVFASGEQTGARVGFHSVPKCVTAIPSIGCRAGDYAQPLASVGLPAYRGQSHGCIRVLPDEAVRLWASLPLGARVTVLN